MKSIAELIRLIELLDWLSRHYYSIDEIADEMNASIRTAERFLDQLQDQGILIRRIGWKPRKYQIVKAPKSFTNNLFKLSHVIHRLNA